MRGKWLGARFPYNNTTLTDIRSIHLVSCTMSKMSASVSLKNSKGDSEPSRGRDGAFHFRDYTKFLPNRSPKEILQAGSFGGTYFRPIKSAVCPKIKFGDEVWKELPKDWLEGLDPSTQLCSSVYRASNNKYGVKCGASLEEWEQSGWIKPQDPYGWFQWYCRFFLGRRTDDDDRQISRWIACAGETSGRWRNRLCKTIFQQSKQFDDYSASPVIRQTLLHWGYELTEDHYRNWGKRQGAEPATSPAKSSGNKPANHKRAADDDDGETGCEEVGETSTTNKPKTATRQPSVKRAKKTIEDESQITSINRTSNPDKPKRTTQSHERRTRRPGKGDEDK